MPVGHERINDPNVQPNNRITFIHTIKIDDRTDKIAGEILNAIAAQFKPIMKEWHFSLQRLEEHAYNGTYAGINYNGGEHVGLVLRKPNGDFYPFGYLLGVMCHELAHCQEMNHSWAFKKVNAQIKQQLAALRSQNYFGDGFYSSGRLLNYSGASAPLLQVDAPEFLCGGARKKSRRARKPNTNRAERGAAKIGNSTGRQTAIPRKPGGRVTKANAFQGEGKSLSEDPAQSSFRKKAGAKSAAQIRAEAAEKRAKEEKRAQQAANGGIEPEFIDDYYKQEEISESSEELELIEIRRDLPARGEIDYNEMKFDSDDETFFEMIRKSENLVNTSLRSNPQSSPEASTSSSAQDRKRVRANSAANSPDSVNSFASVGTSAKKSRADTAGNCGTTSEMIVIEDSD